MPGTESGLDDPMFAVERRTDKREDRVEVGYQQLAEASSIAEVCIRMDACFSVGKKIETDGLDTGL